MGTNKVVDLHFRVANNGSRKSKVHTRTSTSLCVCSAILWHCCSLSSVCCPADGGLQTLINKCDTSCTVPDRGVSGAGRCIGKDRGLV